MQGENPDSQKFFQTSPDQRPLLPRRSWGGGGAPLAPAVKRRDIGRTSAEDPHTSAAAWLVKRRDKPFRTRSIIMETARLMAVKTAGGPETGVQVCLRGPGDEPAQAVEPGAVAGAVPGLLVRVPLQLAAQVGAADVHGVERPRLVPVDPGLFPVEEHDPAVSGRDIFGRLCWDLEESLDHTLDGLPALRQDAGSAAGSRRLGEKRPA